MKLLIAVLFSLCFISAAQTVKMPLHEFERIVILDGGRTKPMDSFARNFMLKISGRSAFGSVSASKWMAGHLLSPGSTIDDAIFKINNEEVLTAMGLNLASARRYSYRQLEPGKTGLYRLVQTAFNKEPAQQDLVEKEAIRLFINMGEYNALGSVFSFASPEKIFVIKNKKLRESLGITSDQPISVLELLGSGGALKRMAGALAMSAGSKLSADDMEIMMLAQHLDSMKPMSQSEVLALLPDFRDGRETWYSAWTYLSEANDGFQDAKIKSLAAAVLAWKNSDAEMFNNSLQKFNELSFADVPADFRSAKPGLEIFNNRLDSFYRAETFYVLAFLAVLFFLLTGKPYLRSSAWYLLLAALCFNTAGLIIRVILTQRPPVTNLYETFLFVALVGAGLAAILEKFSSKGIGIFSASLTGIGMLLISRQFNTDGDSMGVMAAVLRSNFWLTTHVLTISVGYAGTVVAALISHLYLVRAVRNPQDEKGLSELNRMIYGALAVGFIFTFVGTVLGGIWADQSWGRFWGWDPKENGALLIILWTSIVLHAKVTKIIGNWGFAMGTAFGAVFVMLAWFGVNLLGVGLHSYGFISGIAAGLAVYFAAEVIFLAVCHFKKPSAQAVVPN